MTNRSDRGSNKPRGAERFERDDVIRDPIRGLHQGQQPCGAAPTGRTHRCTRPVLVTAKMLLHRRGRPHMAQRPHHCTVTLVQGASTRHFRIKKISPVVMLGARIWSSATAASREDKKTATPKPPFSISRFSVNLTGWQASCFPRLLR